ncbi:MAG: B12-binding domain-containing radical SAM protein [Candidatus Schekmanbacteria bacterium]|nr:B12-binding domain-containing radical SAM protein [Candidatus Schekmanbacteria bacterium]
MIVSNKNLRILLVYPEHPRTTYWSFSQVLSLTGKRSAMPPLGLVTVAALLPEKYELRLVDMNVEPLTDEDILWADAVFTSTMIVQEKSLDEVIARAHRLRVPVVAGGPHPTACHDRIDGVSHLVLGEAEDVMERFLEDFEHGCAAPVYRAQGMPDVTRTPQPRFDLLRRDAYASMAVQYSRGCPYHCEFCDIWKLYGNRPRVKQPEQVVAELDALYELGWRGAVFFVDDNFIGNKKLVKQLLPHIGSWQAAKGYPFSLFTEASVNLAGDEELLIAMRDAGFSMVFLGIETPSSAALSETKKMQNMRMDLLASVHAIQAAGMEVSAGFIVGFDSDEEDIFDRQIAFIEKARIPMAMVGVLTALPGTELYARLAAEGRLTGESEGNNTHTMVTNFKTRLEQQVLADGYERIIATLYDLPLRNYFRRCRAFLSGLGPNPHFGRRTDRKDVRALGLALVRAPWTRHGRAFLRFLAWSLLVNRRGFPEAARLGIVGFHFREITRGAVGLRALDGFLREKLDAMRALLARAGQGSGASNRLAHLVVRKTLALTRSHISREVRRRLRSLPRDYRPLAASSFEAFLVAADALVIGRHEAPFPDLEWAARRLQFLRTYLTAEADTFLQHVDELRDAVQRGFSDLDSTVRLLLRARRASLREARRRIRLLPAEYRLVARSEYRRFALRMAELGRELQALGAWEQRPRESGA